NAYASSGQQWIKPDLTTSSARPSIAHVDRFVFGASLSYLDALTDGGKPRTHVAEDVLSPTLSAEEMGRSFSPSVKSQVVLYEANDNLEQAMKAVDAGEFDKARQIVATNDAYLNDNIGFVRGNEALEAQMSGNAA